MEGAQSLSVVYNENPVNRITVWMRYSILLFIWKINIKLIKHHPNKIDEQSWLIYWEFVNRSINYVRKGIYSNQKARCKYIKQKQMQQYYLIRIKLYKGEKSTQNSYLERLSMEHFYLVGIKLRREERAHVVISQRH